MSDYITLTDDTFDKEVLDSELPVLVDIWAPWCAPCQFVAPAIEQIATEYKGKLKVGKLNVDENTRIAQRYGVSSIPALMIFKDGQPVKGVIGAMPKADIEKIILPFLEGD